MGICQKNNFTILTHDVDFEKLLLLNGTPPKVIVLKTFNQNTKRGSLRQRFHENDAWQHRMPGKMAREQRQIHGHLKFRLDTHAWLACNHATHPHKRVAMRQHCLDNFFPARIRDIHVASFSSQRSRDNYAR